VPDAGYLRIGELSRRAGVAPALLRAWERRYGLLSPSRSAGGFRLYSDDDVRRIRSMRALLAEGYSAAEAARLAAEAPAAPEAGASSALDDGRRALERALDGFDEPAANAAFDRLLGSFNLETVLRDVVLPYLRSLGERWERGEASVAQEHFASNLLRGRLLGLARGWGQGAGPRALLACAPGELHDLPLIAFGLALRARGWRVTYFGPDTPIDTLADAAAELDPAQVVVSAATGPPLRVAAGALRELAERWPLAIAGRGASEALAAAAGTELLAGDPIEAAERLGGG
jgi:MerR family transcriptional regulator, light-induced transcriptional regulator